MQTVTIERTVLSLVRYKPATTGIVDFLGRTDAVRVRRLGSAEFFPLVTNGRKIPGQRSRTIIGPRPFAVRQGVKNR